MAWQQMHQVDEFRLRILRDLMGIRTVALTWPRIAPTLSQHLGNSPSPSDIRKLGDALSDSFRAASVPGRSQSSISGGGAMWERLVIWYLNLCAFGSGVLITTPKRALAPHVLRDSVSVTIWGKQTNTESDVFVFSTPPSLLQTVGTPSTQLTSNQLDQALRASLQNETLWVVQCKTNWNDNAQIPMLWDMIYRSPGSLSSLPGIRVGSGGVSPTSFGNFAYAFATVPSNTGTNHVPGSLPVSRVSGLSGGNYWGRPTRNNVATSISELLNQGFGSYFSGGLDQSIGRAMTAQPDLVADFLTLSF